MLRKNWRGELEPCVRQGSAAIERLCQRPCVLKAVSQRAARAGSLHGRRLFSPRGCAGSRQCRPGMRTPVTCGLALLSRTPDVSAPCRAGSSGATHARSITWTAVQVNTQVAPSRPFSDMVSRASKYTESMPATQQQQASNRWSIGGHCSRSARRHCQAWQAVPRLGSLSSVGRGEPRLVAEEPRLRPRGRRRMRLRVFLRPVLLPAAADRQQNSRSATALRCGRASGGCQAVRHGI
jgi:hypothetical protein